MWRSASNTFDTTTGYAITPQWIQLQYPVPVAMDSFELNAQYSFEAYDLPLEFSLESSADGSTYELVEAYVNTSDPLASSTFDVALSPNLHRYWRINITRVNTGRNRTSTDVVFHSQMTLGIINFPNDDITPFDFTARLGWRETAEGPVINPEYKRHLVEVRTSDGAIDASTLYDVTHFGDYASYTPDEGRPYLVALNTDGLRVHVGNVEVEPESTTTATAAHIMEPCVNICGGTIDSSTGEYSGTIASVVCLRVMSSVRALTPLDFAYMPVPMVLDADNTLTIPGKIAVRTESGSKINVDVVRLQNDVKNLKSPLASQVQITGCEPSDSWLVQTDNTAGPLQAHVTASFDPTLVASIATKDSPEFTSDETVVTNPNWPTIGWRVTASSTINTSSGVAAWRAFQNINSEWKTANNTFNGGNGLVNNSPQWIQIEYPYPVTMHSFTGKDLGTSSNDLLPREFHLSASQFETTGFETVEAFVATTQFSVAGDTFAVTQPHPARKYWRFNVTRIFASGGNAHGKLSRLVFHTGWSVGRIALSTVLPMANDHSFKIVLADTDGRPLSMLDTPVDWQFNIMLTKAGRIVNTGRYNFSRNVSGNGVVTNLDQPFTPISITGLTPSDSWIVNTDNTSGTLHVSVSNVMVRDRVQISQEIWALQMQPPVYLSATVVPIDSASFKLQWFMPDGVLIESGPVERHAYDNSRMTYYYATITIRKNGVEVHPPIAYDFTNDGGVGVIVPVSP
jgi:hypothetical protein